MTAGLPVEQDSDAASLLGHCLDFRQLHALHFSPVTSRNLGTATSPLLNEIQVAAAEPEASF